MACIDAAYVGPPAMATGVTRAPVYFVSHGTALHTMDPKDAARMALQSEARALRPLVRAGERVVAIVSHCSCDERLGWRRGHGWPAMPGSGPFPP